MPKRLVNGELVDVVDAAPSSSSAASSSSLSVSSSLSTCCPKPPATLRETVLYSVPAFGKQVPLLAIVALLLCLGLLAGKQASLTTGLVLGFLLCLGYSPASDQSSSTSNGASSSAGHHGGVAAVRTVRDFPPQPRAGG